MLHSTSYINIERNTLKYTTRTRLVYFNCSHGNRHKSTKIQPKYCRRVVGGFLNYFGTAAGNSDDLFELRNFVFFFMVSGSVIY